MNADGADFKHVELTDRIIKCFYTAYNALGYGFLEKVYENSLLMELEQSGIKAKTQFPIKVSYRGAVVGDYYADLLVEDLVIIEIKAASHLLPEHEAQLLNYLKATDLEVGLLFNFGPKPEIKRKAYNNSRKNHEHQR